MTALRFDGVNDVVTIPTGMTGNAGTSSYSFRIKSGPSGITLPSTANAAFVGTSASSTTSGISVTSAGALRIYTAGTNRYGSADGLISTGVPFDFTLTHAAGGAWDIYNNLTSTTVISGTFTTNTSFSTLTQFGRGNNSTTTYLQGDIELIAVTGLANAETWDANLSGGTGSVLPTVSGNNQGTLVNFPTNNSQWVNTAGGAAVSFSGPVPNQSVNKDTLFNLDVSGYFVGDFTPFTYSVETGTLPAGLSLNTSTGVITGTPTAYGRSSGISIKATDSSSFTAVTNTFAITVGPYGVLFDADSYLFLSRTVQYIEVEFMFMSGATRFSIAGVSAPDVGNEWYFDTTPSGQFTVQTPNGVIFGTASPYVQGVWYTVKLELTGGGSLWRVYRNNIEVTNGNVGLSSFLFDYVGYNPMGPAWSNNVLMRRFTAGANAVTQETWTWTTSNINNAGMTGTLNGSASFQQMTASAWTTYVPEVVAKLLKYHNGTTWITKPLKYHNGTTWVTKPLKYHNGTTWS